MDHSKSQMPNFAPEFTSPGSEQPNQRYNDNLYEEDYDPFCNEEVKKMRNLLKRDDKHRRSTQSELPTFKKNRTVVGRLGISMTTLDEQSQPQL